MAYMFCFCVSSPTHLSTVSAVRPLAKATSDQLGALNSQASCLTTSAASDSIASARLLETLFFFLFCF